jgi:hypothetical protein
MQDGFAILSICKNTAQPSQRSRKPIRKRKRIARRKGISRIMTDHSRLRKPRRYLISISAYVIVTCLAYLAVDTMRDVMMRDITALLEVRQSCDSILTTAISSAITTVTFSGRGTSSTTELVLLKKSELIESCGLKDHTKQSDTK